MTRVNAMTMMMMRIASSLQNFNQFLSLYKHFLNFQKYIFLSHLNNITLVFFRTVNNFFFIFSQSMSEITIHMK